jgi:hypothetical protein
VETLQASRSASGVRVYRERLKVSLYLWLLARHIQLNRPIALSRSSIVELLDINGGLTEFKLLHQAMRYGLLRKKEFGLYIPDYEVADTLVHRIPIGIVEGQQVAKAVRETRLWREAIRLRQAWKDFVRWSRAGMSPTEIPVEAIAVLESFGIRPFVKVIAPNGLEVYTIQFKDIYLITRKLSGGIFLFCADLPGYGQGAKLCSIKKKVLLEHLVPPRPEP